MADLKQSVQYIKGVGPNRAAAFNSIGINTVEDLLTHFPREYEERSKRKKIAELQNGEEATITARVVAEVSVNRIRKNMTILKTIVEDDTGRCTVTWFNQVYIKQNIKRGETYHFFGKFSNNFGRIEVNTPVFDKVGQEKNTGKMMPVYSSTYQLSQTAIRQAVENALKTVKGDLPETIPEYLLQEYQLMDRMMALSQIHFPHSKEEQLRARKRLVFEEFFLLQLALLELKNQNEQVQGIAFDKNIKMSDVINQLPFKLTKAQLRVLEEIDNDMESNKNMNRLLQGDVGSGKTVVAIVAAYKAVKSGYQVAVMAPTAILATQHLEEFQKMLQPFGINCRLLLGATKPKEKQEILEQLENGEIDVIIGTHSLISENVTFAKLGLAITDEQHRFGVKQRATISSKGQNPDVLVMTATPIPRTLALIVYGDLDISIIDELPPNRKKIETYAVTKRMEERVNGFIRQNIAEGRQVYVVCPLVEEKEGEEDEGKAELKSVKEWTEKYQHEVFPEYRVACVYGKMKPKEKDSIMEQFKNGEIDILVSTTVIEVGVNVPNASIMVVENAERFGLSQLHQLRGRVGRGQYQSYCILKYNSKCSDVARERMKTMQETNDGFVIAEKDLELRGTGEFFGTKQHGLPEFKIANIFVDMPMLKSVQSVAQKIEAEDPGLQSEKNGLLRKAVDEKLKQQISL
ncbi:MAG: ATP-dependent DNA helicase RecG [Clostridia bacterium]|nr:ATP-dependent DNA helicase RecG [Clostridia bacterium]